MIAGTRRVTAMTGDDGRRAILWLPGLGIISSALVRSPHHLHGVLDVTPLIGLLGFALAFASLRILSRLRDRREAVPLEHLPRDHVNLHFRYHVALPMLLLSAPRGSMNVDTRRLFQTLLPGVSFLFLLTKSHAR